MKLLLLVLQNTGSQYCSFEKKVALRAGLAHNRLETEPTDAPRFSSSGNRSFSACTTGATGSIATDTAACFRKRYGAHLLRRYSCSRKIRTRQPLPSAR